ncbi:MAG: hypothetical protein EOM90_04250 [Alphaproteobacteria bacterium]|nr:hypothetical protein [Alphaproteobacteria bacterium]
MKLKFFLPFLLALLISFNLVYSQESPAGKNEIRIGYGVLTGPEMANSLISIWPAIGIEIMKDTIKDYTCSFSGVPTLEYNRFLQPWVSVGGSLSFNPISTEITSTKGFRFTYSYYVLSVMPKVNFYYLRKGIFSMYSGVEAGCALILWRDRQGQTTVTDGGMSFAFQVNGLGIRIGKEIGGFMEWGFGFRGVVNFGLSARF